MNSNGSEKPNEYNPEMHSKELPRNHDNLAIDTGVQSASRPSLKRSIIVGAIGFSITSMAVFGSVAFAQRWFYDRLGVTGAFLAWLALFILLGGRLLSPLAAGALSLLRFYALFGSAFLAYGISWIAAYFTLKNAAGEWLGSLVGSVLMAVVFAAGLNALRSAPILSTVLFVANSIGYFLGSVIYYSLGKPIGLLLWGGFYGVSLGAGLGAAFSLAQSKQTKVTRD